MPSDDDLANEMLETVGRYLKSRGWNVVVIGSPRVQQQLLEAKLNFEFVLKFTGAPPKDHKWKGEDAK